MRPASTLRSGVPADTLAARKRVAIRDSADWYARMTGHQLYDTRRKIA